jgi:hypothetical protein
MSFFYLWLLSACAYTPPMGETLEQRLENKKRIVLEKQGQIHSLLSELSELVQDGDRLAIEGYFRIRGWGTGKSAFFWEIAPRTGNSCNGWRMAPDKIYFEMTKRDAVNEVLIKAARPMTTVEVYEELVKGGYPFSGKDPLAVFRTEIYKYADKADRGLFVVSADYVRAQRKNGSIDRETHLDGNADGDGEFNEAFGHIGQVGQRQRAMVLLLEGHLDVAALEEGLGDLRGLNGYSGVSALGELEGWEEEEFLARWADGAAEGGPDAETVLELEKVLEELGDLGELVGFGMSEEDIKKVEDARVVDSAEAGGEKRAFRDLAALLELAERDRLSSEGWAEVLSDWALGFEGTANVGTLGPVLGNEGIALGS